MVTCGKWHGIPNGRHSNEHEKPRIVCLPNGPNGNLSTRFSVEMQEDVAHDLCRGAINSHQAIRSPWLMLNSNQSRELSMRFCDGVMRQLAGR